MKPILVWPICWTLYGIGDAASRGIARIGEDDPILLEILLSTYQTMMGWSYRIQLWAEGGKDVRRYSRILPWRSPEQKES